MKHQFKVILFIIAIFLLGCRPEPRGSSDNNLSITGSGHIISRTVDVTNFDRIESGLTFQLVLQQGDQFQVQIWSDDNFIDYIEVTKQGTLLTLDLKPGHAYNLNGVTTRVEVTAPELAGLNLSSSSSAELRGIELPGTFTAELAGSAILTGELAARETIIEVNGGAFLKLGGYSQRLDLDVCGNGVVDLRDFQAENADIEASCHGQALLNVAGKLDAQVSQAARVEYVGQPFSGNRVVSGHGRVGPVQ